VDAPIHIADQAAQKAASAAADLLVGEAVGGLKRPFDGLVDLQQGNAPSGASEGEAASGPPHGDHKADVGEALQNLGQMSLRGVKAVGHLARRETFATAGGQQHHRV
jgi:hypothetical protein